MKKIFTKSVLLTLLILGGRLLAMASGQTIAVSSICTVQALATAGFSKTVKAPTQIAARDFKTTASLTAYPNPSRGVTTIVLSQPGDEQYKIRVSNAIGKVIKTIAIESPVEGTEVKVDLSEMPSGLYFYSLLVNDKMVETKRLVLQQ